MCIDYTHLNKTYRKDSYPLPSIDGLVNAVSGFRCLSFMESYSGYNQVPMHPCDEGKTIFISLMANYYYKVMPFRLKYAGATYHRLMNKIFVGHIGTIVEVYIHDMMVKTMEDEKLLTNFETVFGYLCKHIMRLNPQKYAFIIEVREFLGFMLTH